MNLPVVKIEKIENSSEGPVITVSGADLMDGTPIVDIKPYLPYADAIPNATGGFTDKLNFVQMAVNFPDTELQKVSPEKRSALLRVLSEDPRPAYQKDADRVYGFRFAAYEVKFTVKENTLCVQSVSLV